MIRFNERSTTAEVAVGYFASVRCRRDVFREESRFDGWQRWIGSVG